MLDVAGDIVVNDGFDALSLNMVAARARVNVGDLIETTGPLDQLIVAMLNREYAGMFRLIVDHIERDPLGGRLSRIYRHVLSGIYERPLARVIYALDREGLNRVLRASHGYAYVPQLQVRASFIDQMKAAGTVRADVDPAAVSAVISAVSAGTALTAPYGNLDDVVSGLAMMLERSVDTDLADTSAGKAAFFRYAGELVQGTPGRADD